MIDGEKEEAERRKKVGQSDQEREKNVDCQLEKEVEKEKIINIQKESADNGEIKTKRKAFNRKITKGVREKVERRRN